MVNAKISNGTVHKIPQDMRAVFTNSAKLHEFWENITPLARNEWICWVVFPKKIETREKHIRVMIDKMKRGERRPCCWMGCSHRKNK